MAKAIKRVEKKKNIIKKKEVLISLEEERSWDSISREDCIIII